MQRNHLESSHIILVSRYPVLTAVNWPQPLPPGMVILYHTTDHLQKAHCTIWLASLEYSERHKIGKIPKGHGYLYTWKDGFWNSSYRYEYLPLTPGCKTGNSIRGSLITMKRSSILKMTDARKIEKQVNGRQTKKVVIPSLSFGQSYIAQVTERFCLPLLLQHNLDITNTYIRKSLV